MRKTLAATATVLVAGALAACGTSNPPNSNAGSTVGSAVAIPLTPTPTPTPTPVRPTPSGRDLQSYMDCLANPATTLDYCRQFDPSPSTSPTPTGHVVHMTGTYTVYNTGGDCVSTPPHADINPQMKMQLEDNNGTLLASAPLGIGAVNAAKACVYTLDFGQVSEQDGGYVTKLSNGLHGQLTWTKLEVQGLHYKFGISIGSAS